METQRTDASTSPTVVAEMDKALDKITSEDTAQEVEETTEKTTEPTTVEEKPKEVPLTETPEFQLAVEQAATKQAQSMKDKELTPIYEENTSLKAVNASLKDALGVLEIAEIEAWGDETPTKELHKERRALTERAQTMATLAAGLDREAEALEKDKAEVNAWQVAIKAALPEGTETFSKLQSFVEELKVCGTDKERELLSQVRAKDFVSTGREKPERPDSSRPSGTGGGGRMTRKQVAEFDPRGKSHSDMAKEQEVVLDQLFKK